MRPIPRMRTLVLLVLGFASAISTAGQQPSAPIELAQGILAGEVTEDSAILQSRLTRPVGRIDTRWSGIPGAPGFARFELSTDGFTTTVSTVVVEALPENDFIVKTRVAELRPSTVYEYRLNYGTQRDLGYVSEPARFRTHDGAASRSEWSFAVVTGMNYSFFHHIGGGGYPPANGEDKELGYPGLESIRELEPQFFIGTGDNVYYDHPALGRAQSLHEMRKKHYEQFSQPRFRALFQSVATYWMKDDHDYRWDDADPHNPYRGGSSMEANQPSHELGVAVFREQLPVVDPADPGALTYRTHRLNKDLQIWLLEARDYRSPNTMPDGPGKSVWGERQREWLEQTLVASDATFKVIVTPTPLVGPDDARKKDNHTNIGGFQHEGNAFLTWLEENGFLEKGLYFVSGDRHWQYHSIHPSGFEEFSCGALVRQNSRLGRKPGDARSTDPNGLIEQPFTNDRPTGGFLLVKVTPDDAQKRSVLDFVLYSDVGEQLYRESKVGVWVE